VQGFGTEKLEDELHIFFPGLKVGRMDLDAIRTKAGHNKLIHEFEEEKLQVLVGTQMVTKGLDFDKVSLVGIMSADQLLNYADFRATERAYQLMEQVSGRAGRKHKRGKVVIQTNSLNYPTLQFIRNYDYDAFYNWEIAHRSKFSYPPYVRLIKLTVKHKDKKITEDAAIFLSNELKKVVGKRLIGPAEPYVGRIQLYYLQELMIKMEKSGAFINEVKHYLRNSIDKLLAQPGFSSVRTEIDVDPY
jgi:primosomal protein N' (replication factor Y)